MSACEQRYVPDQPSADKKKKGAGPEGPAPAPDGSSSPTITPTTVTNSFSPIVVVPSCPILLFPELLYDLAVEPVVPAERHEAGQPTLPRPARHGVRGHAEQLRNLRSGQKLGFTHLDLGRSHDAEASDLFIQAKSIKYPMPQERCGNVIV